MDELQFCCWKITCTDMLPMTSCGCSEFKIFTPHVFLHEFHTISNGILCTTNYMCLCHSYLASILCDCLGLDCQFYSIVFPLLWATSFMFLFPQALGKVYLRTMTCCSTMASKFVTFEGKTKIGVPKLFWGTWIWCVNFRFFVFHYFMKSCILKKIKWKIPTFSNSSTTILAT